MFKIFVYSFCLWFLLSNPVVKAQESLTELIDSLAVAQNQMTSFELCLKIADELKYSDKTRAAHYLELARKKAENIDKEKSWKEFYKQSAQIYYDLDAFDISIEYLLKEYEFYEKSDEKRKYEIEGQLGIIYARMNNQNKALYYFEKLQKHYQKKKNFGLLSRIENNIGNFYLTNGMPDSALIYFNKALSHLKKNPNLQLQIYLNTNLARCYDRMNRVDTAEIYYQKALTLANDSVDLATLSFVNQSFGVHFLDKGDFENAIHYSKIAERIEPSTNSFSQRDLLETLYKAYLNKGRSEERSVG